VAIIDIFRHTRQIARMKVSLGNLEQWIKDQVRHGDYSSDSEVVRDAVRRLKNFQPSEPEILQRALDEAETSGFKPFTQKDWRSLRKLARTGAAK
jgi:putative addiction module CopG family antidote